MSNSANKSFWRSAGLVLAVAAMVCFWYWLFFSVFRMDLPKTSILRKQNVEWQEKFGIINMKADQCDAVLKGIESRDNDVYRSIFGLNPIPQSAMDSGFGGLNRYSYLDEFGANESLKQTVRRMDVMLKRSYLQSLALDEVDVSVKEAGDMISCIPSIPPLLPKKGTYNLSSPFGRRTDPVYGGGEFHKGQDIAAKIGTHVYAPGDGVVEVVDFKYSGYGNEVVLDHGFGYKTRYAHLSRIDVGVGQKLKRGDKIGEVGRSGKSTGAHLHYEVLYRGKQVNPSSFIDWQVPLSDYRAMIEKCEAEREGTKTSASSLLARKKKQGADGR